MNAGPASHLKTHIVTAVVVLANLFGNLSLSWGLKQPGAVLTASPLSYLKVVVTPWVAFGILLLILWMLCRITLLSWADLSYVLPVTAIGYVLTVVAGKAFLLEQVLWQRWAGSLLVMAGVAIVSSTPVRTGVQGGTRE